MLKRICLLSALGLIVIFRSGEALSGNFPKPSEYDVKAAYIYNFAKFIEWPRNGDSTIHVCVLGDDPIRLALSLVDGKRVGDKKIRVTDTTTLESIRNCEIVFIARSERISLRKILNSIYGLAILTVSDTDGFARKGVMINLYSEGNKIRFEINLKAVSSSGLKISSNLLRIAKLIEDTMN